LAGCRDGFGYYAADSSVHQLSGLQAEPKEASLVTRNRRNKIKEKKVLGFFLAVTRFDEDGTFEEYVGY
jgi:hypothetical protein